MNVADERRQLAEGSAHGLREHRRIAAGPGLGTRPKTQARQFFLECREIKDAGARFGAGLADALFAPPADESQCGQNRNVGSVLFRAERPARADLVAARIDAARLYR